MNNVFFVETEQAPEAISEDTYEVPDVDPPAMGRMSVMSTPGTRLDTIGPLQCLAYCLGII